MEYESNGKTTNCSTENEIISISSKKTRTSTSFQDPEDFRFFKGLPDDLVIAIASRLGASADCPAHLLNFRLTCKRMNVLGFNPLVLSVLSPKAFACSAKNWCNQAHKFLIFCKNAGNLEATYTLGMIWFYYSEGYEKMRRAGLSLITIAAEKYHPAALYSLAVIKFNGSDTGGRSPKGLKIGVHLAIKAALLGNNSALRELGLCLQTGYGVRKNVDEGQRFLVQANAREFISIVPYMNTAGTAGADSLIPGTIKIEPPKSLRKIKDPRLSSHRWITSLPNPNLLAPQHHTQSSSPLMSDYGYAVPEDNPHPANQFLAEWFKIQGGPKGAGLRLCSNELCGIPETRRNEFHDCSICEMVTYCSGACQAYNWKMRHMLDCRDNAGEDNDGEGNDNGGGSDNEDEEMVEIDEVEDADEIDGNGDM